MTTTIEKLATAVAARAAEFEDAKREYNHTNHAQCDAMNKMIAAEKALKEATAKFMEALPK